MKKPAALLATLALSFAQLSDGRINTQNPSEGPNSSQPVAEEEHVQEFSPLSDETKLVMFVNRPDLGFVRMYRNMHMFGPDEIHASGGIKYNPGKPLPKMSVHDDPEFRLMEYKKTRTETLLVPEMHTHETFLDDYNFAESLLARLSYYIGIGGSGRAGKQRLVSIIENANPEIHGVGHYLRDILLTRYNAEILDAAARALYRIEGERAAGFLLSLAETDLDDDVASLSLRVMAENKTMEALPLIARKISVSDKIDRKKFMSLMPYFGDATLPFIESIFHAEQHDEDDYYKDLFSMLVGEIGTPQSVATALKHMTHGEYETKQGYYSLIDFLGKDEPHSFMSPEHQLELGRAKAFREKYGDAINSRILKLMYGGAATFCEVRIQMTLHLAKQAARFQSYKNFRDYICDHSLVYCNRYDNSCYINGSAARHCESDPCTCFERWVEKICN